MNNSNVLLEKDFLISELTPLTIPIVDDVEGDMTFTIHIKHDESDPSSYTQYVVRDAFHADIDIVNPNIDVQTSVKDKCIVLGTYKRVNLLLFEFVLYPDINGQRRIHVKFLYRMK